MKTGDMRRLQRTDSTGAGRLKQVSILNARARCSGGFDADEEAS